MNTKDQAYWENKHPAIRQLYAGRPLPNGVSYNIDIRHFIWADDYVLKDLIAKENLKDDNNDITANNMQKYVVQNLQYVSDEKLGRSEYWLFPGETLYMHRGDCEDGGILMASLLLNALPVDQHWRVRVAAGNVWGSDKAPYGGHAYLTYCRCTDNEWVICDWCYYQDSSIPVNKKPLAKDVGMYKDIWFSWNHLHSYSHMSFALAGRLNEKTFNTK